jgi:hypothetical protein
MGDWVDRVLIGIFVLIGAGTVFIIGLCIYLMIQGPWYGEGTVTEKSHSDSYLSYCGKGCFIRKPECHRLKIVEYNGNEHTRCVSRSVWEDAMLGHHIAITKEYN